MTFQNEPIGTLRKGTSEASRGSVLRNLESLELLVFMGLSAILIRISAAAWLPPCPRHGFPCPNHCYDLSRRSRVSTVADQTPDVSYSGIGLLAFRDVDWLCCQRGILSFTIRQYFENRPGTLPL
jgi:hypothetical protein